MSEVAKAANDRTTKPKPIIRFYVSSDGTKFRIILTTVSSVHGYQVHAKVPDVYNRICSGGSEQEAFRKAEIMIDRFQSHPLKPQSKWKELTELIIKHFPDCSRDDAISEADTVDDIVCSLMVRLAVPKIRRKTKHSTVTYNEHKSTATALRRLKKAILARNQYAWHKAHLELGESAKDKMREPFFEEDGEINFSSQIFKHSFTRFHVDIISDYSVDYTNYVSHIEKAISSASKDRRPKAQIIDEIAGRFVKVWIFQTQLSASQPNNLVRDTETRGTMVAFVCEAMDLYGLTIPAKSGAAWQRILSKLSI